MRFSIRLLLAGTAYVAVATAAITSGNILLADLVWAVSWLASCYAIVCALIARKQRQAIAIGFICLATANLAAMYLAPSQTPAMRLFSAAGYFVVYTGEAYIQDPTSPGGRQTWR